MSNYNEKFNIAIKILENWALGTKINLHFGGTNNIFDCIVGFWNNSRNFQQPSEQIFIALSIIGFFSIASHLVIDFPTKR